MARPAAHLVTILFAVISEYFILQTSASFFIEYVDRDRNSPNRVKLFECPAAAWTESFAVASRKTSARPQTSASGNNQDIVCTEVVDNNAKTQIYSKANFFAIFPRLNGDKKIKVGGVVLSSYFSNTFLGVTLREEAAQWPVFLDDGKQVISFQARFFSRFLTGVNMDRVTNFAVSGNFRALSQPTPEMTANFKEYVKMMENVQRAFAEEAYKRARWVSVNRNANSAQPEEANLLDDTRFTINFLLQKMIDPCFSPVENAAQICDQQCKFLSVAFAANPGHDTPDCSRAIAYGSCLNRICMCAIRLLTFNCECGIKNSEMIKCSSALRISTVGSNLA